LTDAEAVRVFVERYRPETVIHLAGLVTGRQESVLGQEMFDQNERATLNLLSAVSRTGCRRIVLAGSVQEDSISSPYGVAKRSAYLRARYFHEQAGLPMVYCRLHLGYGPGQEKAKLIPYLIGSLLGGRVRRSVVRSGSAGSFLWMMWARRFCWRRSRQGWQARR
jgi:nucleoside-diphosphate-sugar epimerase